MPQKEPKMPRGGPVIHTRLDAHQPTCGRRAASVLGTVGEGEDAA